MKYRITRADNTEHEAEDLSVQEIEELLKNNACVEVISGTDEERRQADLWVEWIGEEARRRENQVRHAMKAARIMEIVTQCEYRTHVGFYDIRCHHPRRPGGGMPKCHCLNTNCPMIDF